MGVNLILFFLEGIIFYNEINYEETNHVQDAWLSKIYCVFTTMIGYKLRTGPDLLNSLVGVLLWFREQSVGLASDIEAMFHQVQVQDQPALRFLF